MNTLLPLFPLDVVLFPGSPLPLHIFEPRYKEMIGECLTNNAVFGVVRAVENGFASVGCTAEILTVTKKYDDGRMDIITEGRGRFEVLEVNRERSFLQAEVVMLEADSEAAPAESRKRAIELHADILSIAGAVQDVSTAAPETLSFHLAASLPLDLDFKQTLLALHSEGERISTLISYLEALLPKVQRASRARQVAGGNGHAH